MAFTYATLRPAITDTWIDRVEGALLAAAVAISVDAPDTPLDLRRDHLARVIIRDGRAWANAFALPTALGFLAKTDLVGSVSDAEIDTRISSIFNDFIT